MLFKAASIIIFIDSIVASFSYLARAFLSKKCAAEVISRYSNASAVLLVNGTAILWQRILLWPSEDEYSNAVWIKTNLLLILLDRDYSCAVPSPYAFSNS